MLLPCPGLYTGLNCKIRQTGGPPVHAQPRHGMAYSPAIGQLRSQPER